MNPEEISRKIDELRHLLESHTDLLGIINAQIVITNARQETILSVLREVLAKHGVDKTASQEICGKIFAQCLVVAESENARSLKSAGRTRLPSASGPESEKN
jgi:hypothetical protein